MDQGLKERLIGAAVLVALGVWLIPWVLDGQSEQGESQTAALQLPVPEQPVPIRSQTIRLDEERRPPAPVAEQTIEITTARAAEPAAAGTATVDSATAQATEPAAEGSTAVDSAPAQTPPVTGTAPPERHPEQGDDAAEPPRSSRRERTCDGAGERPIGLGRATRELQRGGERASSRATRVDVRVPRGYLESPRVGARHVPSSSGPARVPRASGSRGVGPDCSRFSGSSRGRGLMARSR